MEAREASRCPSAGALLPGGTDAPRFSGALWPSRGCIFSGSAATATVMETDTETGASLRIDKADQARRNLEASGWIRVILRGGCMEPTLREGRSVLVRQCTDPRRGDVALIDARGWLEVHRIVDRLQMGSRRWFVHLGDAGSVCGLANRRDILGVMVDPNPGRRRMPAPRAHVWALALRLGALLEYLGLRPPRPRRTRRVNPCSARSNAS